MTVGELIEELQLALDTGFITEDTEIEYIAQPNWPMKYSLEGPFILQSEENGEDNKILFAESQQIGYPDTSELEAVEWK